MMNYSLVFIFILLNSELVAVVAYEDLHELIQKEYLNFINSTFVPAVKTVDTHISSKSVTFNDVHEFIKTIYPILYMLATVLVSLIVYCLQKCYRNNGECKIAWFIPKRPSEYQRRREVTLQREMALDHLVQQRYSTAYSIA